MNEEFKLNGVIRAMGINIFGIISAGQDESVEVIENHISKGDLVEYILNKYSNIIHFPENDDFELLEKYFCSLDGVVQGNASRKYAVHNDSGLLFVLALLFDKGLNMITLM